MAEYVYNPIQEVETNQPVLLQTSIGCNKGYVLHRNGSGILTLRGIVNNQFSCFARYQVTFNGNIAVPTGETVGPIAIVITDEGEPILSSKAMVPPTVVDTYYHVTSTAFITVPKGCCEKIAVENISAGGIPINVQNANLIVTRVA
jgi:hypothetical protein